MNKNMSNYTFPAGVTYEQYYITGADFLPDNYQYDGSVGNLIRNCENNVLSLKFSTSNISNFQYFFNNCNNLATIPEIDTSNATNVNYMFSGCSALHTIPELDFSNVTSSTYLFQSCLNLKRLPNLNLIKNTSLNYTFYGCSALISIGEIRCDSVSSISTVFGYSNISTLMHIGGFKNLGMKSSVSGTSSSFLNYLPNLTHESAVNIINGLYDRASAGYSVLTLKFHANTLAKLTDEEIAIATNKGWTIS